MTIVKFPRRATTLGLLTLGSLAAFSLPSLAFATLTAHRAVYDLELKAAKDRSGVKDLTGRMAIEITGSSCEGWSVNFRLVNDLQLPRGKRRLIDSRSTAWEAGDGSRLSYVENEFIDNRPTRQTRLSASLKSHKVTLKKPKKAQFRLPDGAVFPVAHQLRLIEKARQGELRDKSIVYDGSDQRNIYEAITFIGKKRNDVKVPKNLKGGGGVLIKGETAWPVTVSYYSIKDTATRDTPAQQVSFMMYENGIAGDLVIDYGEWSMRGKLQYLEKLKQSKCDK
jgi:hypothetical protein